MTDPPEPQATPPPAGDWTLDVEAPETVEDLSRSYGALLDPHREEPEAAAGRSAPLPEPAAPPPLKRVVEGLLFVGGAPLTAVRACETIRGLSPAQLTETIDALNHDYRAQGRPYLIEMRDQGYVMTLRPRFRPVHEKLYGGVREARLSPAVVDALALVAYRQPATKQEVDALRGSDSGHLLRQLVRHGLIAIVQRGDAAQREVAYGTTQRFLDLFRLRSLDDLPQTQDLQKL
jgi:segregation and condensation protein B